VNCSLWASASSLGYNMLEHSEQKRKVICSCFLFAPSAEVVDPGEAMVAIVFGSEKLARVRRIVSNTLASDLSRSRERDVKASDNRTISCVVDASVKDSVAKSVGCWMC
jgi:hypothetical protein